MRKMYTVRYDVEVHAGTPAHAAIAARDAMLNPDGPFVVDVRAMKYVEQIGDFVPCDRRGWYVTFENGTNYERCIEYEELVL